MLYDQTLDLDTFQSFLAQNTDHDPRFYDDFFNLATSREWKSSNRLPGLPTPPSTPSTEKSAFPWSYSLHQSSNPSLTSHNFDQNKAGGNQAPESQVVPDIIQHDGNDYVVPPWFEGNKFFTDQINTTTSSPVDVGRNTTQNINVPYEVASYSSYTDLENQLRLGGEKYSRTQLELQVFDNPILDCAPPVSPDKELKRKYFNPYGTEMALSENAGIRSVEENYYHQLVYEKARARHQMNIIESPPAEQELSKATHNVLERQRRNDLKVRFNILRDSIPELVNRPNDKVAKIQILKKACKFIEELKAQEQKIMVDLELEKQRKKILLNRLKQLTGSY